MSEYRKQRLQLLSQFFANYYRNSGTGLQCRRDSPSASRRPASCWMCPGRTSHRCSQPNWSRRWHWACQKRRTSRLTLFAPRTARSWARAGSTRWSWGTFRHKCRDLPACICPGLLYCRHRSREVRRPSSWKKRNAEFHLSFINMASFFYYESQLSNITNASIFIVTLLMAGNHAFT